MSQYPSDIDAAEAELQQELREMFTVDTQQHLETYFTLIGQLNPRSWVADIQHLYRAIHTVKGGAVTVAADAMLHTAIVLEDLLSDLRYLEQAPPLEDHQLEEILLEAGELLTSSVEITATGDLAISQVQPTVQRLQQLREQVKQLYLPDWSELKQVHQEFAEQGFNLVILELEMALGKIPDRGLVSTKIIDIAHGMIDQLTQIGQDLELADGWIRSIEYCDLLIDRPVGQLWRQVWPEYFQILKACVKDSGKISDDDLEKLKRIGASEANFDAEVVEVSLAAPNLNSSSELPDLLDNLFAFADDDTTIQSSSELPDLLDNLFDFEDDELTHESLEYSQVMNSNAAIQLILPAPLPELSTTPIIEPISRGIQIPVSLERLDKSAQQVVDTLLTARAVKNISNQLQSQLSKLTNLTQESSQFVAKLRQIQDDYAQLGILRDEQTSSGSNVTLERYHQGYSTINRLLENILRMSELGQEIEIANYQNSTNLDALDRSILRLKDEIETSRLVPFKNMILRARAILRDLTNRYGKLAELITENEQIELDASIVQQLEPALLHLLRNAYDHGLESITQRLASGKPPKGMISLSLNRRGNLYRLMVEDDGGGIDPQIIHQLARDKGFALDRTNTNTELLAVICQPGFTSSSSVSEVSGRGVGMDVVVAQIARIGGKLSLETNLGHGTKFTIEVPAPQLLLPCVLFQVGERTVAIPTDEILETALMSSMVTESVDQATSLCTWKLTTSQGVVSGFDLANYWQPMQRLLPDTAICIRTRQANDTTEIWLIADDLSAQAELLINPLPSPLIAPIGLLGVSLQPDGRMISILDPIALTAKIATAPSHADSYSLITLAIENSKSSSKTILIVDDAALMRRRFESSLNSHGFITYTCNDGVEALNWLGANFHPDLMITDVEMPNMDGFTLIDRCRQAKMDLPILVVSSRLSEEWGKEAHRLGANDYLNKGFSTPELMQKVDRLLNISVVSG